MGIVMAPKKRKYRKEFRGRMKGKAMRGNVLNFGEYGLKAETSGWVSGNQIEAGRKVITRATRKGGKMWIRIFPDKPITHKPAETRMGSGKGEIENYVAVVLPGRILFEISGIEKEKAIEALIAASHKLSVKTRVVSKEGGSLK